MNAVLDSDARQWLKTNLQALPEKWQFRFKQMYGRFGKKRSFDELRATGIDQIVDEMPSDKLDWAMQQVMNSQEKIAKVRVDDA